MKKRIIKVLLLISILVILIIVNEFRKTCFINDNFSKPIENSIKLDLENIYDQKVIINSIDGSVEDNSRIVYFQLSDTGENKIVLYLKSFLPKRLKYIDEIQNIEKYKEYF
ncbi:hypothetical protein [Clostridium sp. UBA1056]|uniref:hypothetical protein n=1 Tax=unclassified Clostridium TaxID=2614128 RepID=UPI0032174742